jgi:hypothetical protein
MRSIVLLPTPLLGLRIPAAERLIEKARFRYDILYQRCATSGDFPLRQQRFEGFIVDAAKAPPWKTS